MHRLNQELQRKINVIRMFNEKKYYNYIPPEMHYDKKTGNVTIKDEDEIIKERKAKIVTTFDEIAERKKKLMAEFGLDYETGAETNDKINAKNINLNEKADKMYKIFKDEEQIN